MTKHIHFDDSASIDAHISAKQSIMSKLADAASTGVYSVDGEDYELTESISAPVGVNFSADLPVSGTLQATGGLNSSGASGTRSVKIFFEDSGSAGEGHLKFQIDGIGTFKIATPVGSGGPIVSFDDP